MKKFRAFCNTCSFEAQDIRVFSKEKNVITCMTCGAKSSLLPVVDDSPYCYIRRDKLGTL